ncbi:uncharacterized protein A4U43_C01F8460 [Asparagus officinalis]|uniref:Uncharacterized protein n=1 Tax=Asparagus officinalis TaxID=4686 RepID=A0A5P1FPK4_ASPOF|nr:uncharacterized protein A4U43_C01F8460 [Asparagus officinalis]
MDESADWRMKFDEQLERSKGRIKKCYRGTDHAEKDKSDHKFKRKDGEAVNQLKKAMAVAVSKFAQWFTLHKLRSLLMRIVMPADAVAAANVRNDVICSTKQKYELPV